MYVYSDFIFNIALRIICKEVLLFCYAIRELKKDEERERIKQSRKKQKTYGGANKRPIEESEKK